MLDIFEMYATDEVIEVEGKEIPLGDGATMHVARANNDRYLARIIEETEKHKEALNAGTPAAQELDKQLTLMIQAETILVHIKGLSFKGKALKDTPKDREKLLGIKDFRRRVLAEANKIENYRIQAEAKDAQD